MAIFKLFLQYLFLAFVLVCIFEYFKLDNLNKIDSDYCYNIAENKFSFEGFIMTDKVKRLLFEKDLNKCCSFENTEGTIKQTCR